MVVNKKFWDGLPADIRTALDKAMKEATELRQRPVAQKENDDALELIKKSGKTEIVTLTPRAGRGDAQGDDAGLQGSRLAGRPAP